jgi:hypothetical protein
MVVFRSNRPTPAVVNAAKLALSDPVQMICDESGWFRANRMAMRSKQPLNQKGKGALVLIGNSKGDALFMASAARFRSFAVQPHVDLRAYLKNLK